MRIGEIVSMMAPERADKGDTKAHADVNTDAKNVTHLGYDQDMTAALVLVSAYNFLQD